MRNPKEPSKLAVRYFWRPIQRITNISANTPSKSWKLREKYNIAMYRWAERQDRLVLIAGHTHRPVFAAKTHEGQIQEQLKKLEEPNGTLSREELEARAELKAELEWIRTQENQMAGEEEPIDPTKPCYFNTGCCAFIDGDLTGIEIADGEVRLVRWPDDEGAPKPHLLVKESLAAVLEAC